MMILAREASCCVESWLTDEGEGQQVAYQADRRRSGVPIRVQRVVGMLFLMKLLAPRRCAASHLETYSVSGQLNAFSAKFRGLESGHGLARRNIHG
jgi:hypothetical protein